MFYTYMWLREDGTPYYVGKGSGDRVCAWHKRMGNAPKDRVVVYIAIDEADAFEMETLLIWYYGRKDIGTGILRNLTDGGEGPAGAKAWNRGVPPSKETREKLRNANLGKVQSTEHKAKIGTAISEARRLHPYGLGRIPWNKDQKGIIVGWNKGKKTSEETRIKQSLSKKGKPWSEARIKARKSMSIEEQKASHRASCAKYAAKKKQEKLCPALQ